uniref:Uncharacterized protein n=1 Tax=Aegilops tauschii subsp. strangulata TaxID=200361 RepID=A0A453GN64_AEGTS
MHVATHWNDYDKSPLKHVIPHAIKDIALNFEMEKDDKVGNDVCTKVIQKGSTTTLQAKEEILQWLYCSGSIIK